MKCKMFIDIFDNLVLYKMHMYKDVEDVKNQCKYIQIAVSNGEGRGYN
jgi:hypothetical protein